MSVKRAYNWTFIVYPDDSLTMTIEEVCEYLALNTYAFVLSPEHSADASNAEEFKTHRHVMIMYDTLKSYSQILEIIEPLAPTLPTPVQSVKGLVRYFCHLDSKNKTQYSLEELIAYNYNVYDVQEKYENEFDIIEDIVRDLNIQTFHTSAHYLNYLIASKQKKKTIYAMNRINSIDKLVNFYTNSKD